MRAQVDDLGIAKALSLIGQSTRTLGPIASSSSSRPVPPLPDGLRSILGTLLQAVRHTTTALALAFKPPVTVPAAVQQLDKVADEYARMVSCVIASASHGSYSALVDEWREGVESVGQELGRLIETLRDGVKDGKGQISTDDNPYLAHTGMVWDAIDRLADLSWTEVDAVQKRFKAQRAIVSDAWSEFKEYLEEEEQDDDEDEDEEEEDGDGLDDLDDEDDDDEWGELERAMGGSKMSHEERQTAEAVSRTIPETQLARLTDDEQAKTLLGLHQVLHASLPRFVVSSPSSTNDPNFRQLLDASSAIVAAFDTAIAAMYPTQIEVEITSALDDLAGRSRAALSATESVLAAMLDNEQRVAQSEKLSSFSKKWLDRLETETKAWHERKMSMSSLQDALP